jgi:hypothetical protein
LDVALLECDQVTRSSVVEVPDLDAALSWAARNPAARFGAVEVRPVWKLVA